MPATAGSPAIFARPNIVEIHTRDFSSDFFSQPRLAHQLTLCDLTFSKFNTRLDSLATFRAHCQCNLTIHFARCSSPAHTIADFDPRQAPLRHSIRDPIRSHPHPPTDAYEMKKIKKNKIMILFINISSRLASSLSGAASS